ncbi:MAG: rhomboid family intramembrane serine protease [Oscillospiraceae bacterium]|nr:rhomboid family intramembrane serine protease [Oscillospiraceae bacterium]
MNEDNHFNSTQKENNYTNTEDLFLDFEQDEVYVIQPQIEKKNSSQNNLIICTMLIIITNIVIYLLCIGNDNYFHVGGLNYEYLTINKEYGRLISHMFIHANFAHISNNMIALFFLGGEIEKKLGSFRFSLIYFGSGIASGIFSVLIHHHTVQDQMTFSAGASGAVYGTLCAGVFLALLQQHHAEKKSAMYAIGLAVIYAVFSFQSGVDIWGHIGGAMFGGILALILSIHKWKNFNENTFFKITAILITICFCIMGFNEAHIGKDLSELPDERIDFIKEQLISQDDIVPYGNGLNLYCTDSKWDAFITEDDEEFVDFQGEAMYNGTKCSVRIQFVLDTEANTYSLYYFGLNDHWQNSKVQEQFFNLVIQRYHDFNK